MVALIYMLIHFFILLTLILSILYLLYLFFKVNLVYHNLIYQLISNFQGIIFIYNKVIQSKVY